MPFDSISSIPSIIFSAGRVSWLAPHLSNQPLQNSEHIRGLSGRTFFSFANCWSMFAPVPKFIVQIRSSRPLLRKFDDQSHWNSVTLSPKLRRSMSRMLPTYSLSVPYEPYSFSTCTMMIGPPLATVRSPTCSATAFWNLSTRSRK